MQQLAGEQECRTSVAVCQEAEMAYLDEVRRQHGKQETAPELDGVECHELLLVPVG
jgi:hypothetical protein